MRNEEARNEEARNEEARNEEVRNEEVRNAIKSEIDMKNEYAIKSEI